MGCLIFILFCMMKAERRFYMDQGKIGKFIADCRKQKNMTQKDFAEKLGVTDKTVSRWENGHYLPDISLFEDICNILEIEISELLHGEKIQEKMDKNEVDKTLKGLVQVSENKIKKRSRYVIFICSIILLLIIIGFGIAIYAISKNESRLNSKIVPGSQVYFPVQYAQLEKEDGWTCYFEIEYESSESNKPYYYSYNCENFKYPKLDGFVSSGTESDSTGTFTYEIPVNHPNYIYHERYSEEVRRIQSYFQEHEFQTVISMEDLSELDLELIDKQEVLDLYNKAISSKKIEIYGNYPEIAPSYLSVSTTKNNYTWYLGYMRVAGNIPYIYLDVKIGNDYLSDIIQNQTATDEQKSMYEAIQTIRSYMLEKQTFELPSQFQTLQPYAFLEENIGDIQQMIR